MSNAKTLEDAVTETAAVVTDWKNSIAKIETQLNSANLALAKSKQEGEIHRAKAAAGDAAAIGACKHAQDAQREAESTITEIRLVALPKAVSQLAEAEREAENARRDLAKPHIEALKREVVADAAVIDEGLAVAAAAQERRLRNIAEIESWERDDGHVSRREDRVGLRRIYSALPAFMRSLPANPTAKFIPLAESDRQFFNLPPEETTTTKAA
jgi:hypothetical protein